MSNYEELERLLDSYGYADGPIKNAALELFYTLDAQDLGPEDRRTVAQLVNSLVEERVTFTPIEGTWEEFRLGETRKGVIVRVRRNAYDTAGGRKHNGLVGNLVDIRSGRCIVQYLGRNDGVGHYHPPHAIEVLKK